jgi:hypothetical protein
MFAVRELHQIEITSRCNLKCEYCPSYRLPRPKVDMTQDHFLKALSWVVEFKRRGTQRDVNLAGIGESTLHPDFVRMVHLAREYLGQDFQLVFATNGLLMTDELAREIAPANPTVFVSLHRPEKAGPAIEALRKYGLLAGVSADPSISSTNWAGQVDYHVSAPKGRPCSWVTGGKVFMFADGRISRCAFDASGVGVIGHIEDGLSKLETSPYVLCRTCDQNVGVPLDGVPEIPIQPIRKRRAV